jgi:hypothetical protein
MVQEDPTEQGHILRAGLEAKFLREVDPNNELTEPERLRRAAKARQVYYQRLALASAKARKARKAKRFKEHERRAKWIDQLAKVDSEWHPTRKAALAAESEAIKSEWPLHNRAGSIGGPAANQGPKTGWVGRNA